MKKFLVAAAIGLALTGCHECPKSGYSESSPHDFNSHGGHGNGGSGGSSHSGGWGGNNGSGNSVVSTPCNLDGNAPGLPRCGQ